MSYLPLPDMKPITPKTATRAVLRWTNRAGNRAQFGGRPYDWRRRAVILARHGYTDIEVSFLTRQGWGPFRKVTIA